MKVPPPPNPAIPVYPLSTLVHSAEKSAAVFFLGPDSAAASPPSLHQPHRSDFYKIGFCLHGRARLRINLETYDLEPGSLVALSPYAIMEWLERSADFASLSLFFTREFASANGGFGPDDFAFFARDARHVLAPPSVPAASLTALLHLIGQKHAAPHPHREQQLRSLLHVLLLETAPLHQAASQAQLTRAQQLAAGFKKLVNKHYTTNRGLAFYADQLCVTPKHLAEAVREATGKRAGEWLTEAVLLEARVLLHNPALSIGQIADRLHFAGPSTFGRFFRHHTGLTPAGYRRQR